MKFLSLCFLLLFLHQGLRAQRNSLRFESGLLHCSFDGTPIINGYPQNYAERQLLYSSIGLQYQRSLKNKIRLQSDLSFYGHSFKLYNGVVKPTDDRSYKSKFYTDLQFCFLKNSPLNKTVAFQYGIGPGMRLGSYTYYPDAVIPPCVGHDLSCLDLGLNSRAEIAYTPLKWLTLFSQVNFTGMLFRMDSPFLPTPDPLKPASKPLQAGFPSRFDLSLRVGLGFNF